MSSVAVDAGYGHRTTLPKLDDSFAEVNFRAGVIFERYDARLTLWGRNVFDEDSTNTIADAVAQDGRLTAYYTEPVRQ